MNAVDAAVVAMLMFGVGGVAYSLGRRNAVVASPPRRVVRPEPEREPEPEPEPAPAPAPPAAPEPEPDPPPVSVPERELAEAFTKPPPAFAAVPILHQGVDEEDVTKVGAPNSGPPPSKVRTIYQPPVRRIVYDEEAAEEEIETPDGEKMFLVHATSKTNTGLRRKHNEDSLLVLEASNLFVVADGMGGYKGGSLASQLVIKTMAEAARTGSYEGPFHEEIPGDASELARAIQMANAEIQEEAQRKPELEGMGTTVCAARFSPTKRRIYVGHVGDSRCYRMRDDVFTMMTRDHTMAEHGVKGPESQHLSRAVGIWPTVPIDIVMGVPQLGDIYLLCSDGLTKMLDDSVIANVLRSEDDPRVAVERLVLFANSRGGKDNITVVLVRVVPPNWKPRSPSGRDLTHEAMAAMAGFTIPKGKA